MGSSAGDSFCLKWNDFQSGITAGFCDIRAANHLLDVTVRCGGTSLQAHRLILSSCSAWFREVLCSLPPAIQNPVVVIWDASPQDLHKVFDFMYRGEVRVQQDSLTSFLALAERLQVRGLTQPDREQQESPDRHQEAEQDNSRQTLPGSSCSSAYSRDLAAGDKLPHPPLIPRKRRKSTALKSPGEGEEKEYSSEGRSVKLEASEQQSHGELIQYSDEVNDSYYDSYYEEEEGGGEEAGSAYSSQQQQQQQQPASIIEATKGMPSHGGNCPICYKFIVTNIRRHMEDLHFPTSTPCTVCGKVFSSNNKMRSHKAYAHRGVS